MQLDGERLYTVRETIPPDGGDGRTDGFVIDGPGLDAGVIFAGVEPSFGQSVCEALERAYRAGLEAQCPTIP